MDLFEAKEKESGSTYIAPDPLFISAISLFSRSLPWQRFNRFFKTKKLVGLTGDEQLILLRFLAIQELTCLNDKALLVWLKNQFYLFHFLQPDFKPRLPTIELLQEFRSELDTIGLLLPFRRQCQHIIQEHGKRFPEITINLKAPSIQNDSGISVELKTALMPDTNTRKAAGQHHLLEKQDSLGSQEAQFVTDKKVEIHNVMNHSKKSCEKCGSHNVIKMKSTQLESSLPSIRFLRCRFCGHTFRSQSGK